MRPDAAGARWSTAVRRPGAWIGAALVAVVLAAALSPDLFTSVAPDDCRLSDSLRGLSPGHPLGFTRQGCDSFARVVHGTGPSVAVGLIATVGAAVIGVAVGSAAGLFGGRLDTVLSRIGEVFLSIPVLLAVIVVVSVVVAEVDAWVVGVSIGAFAWPGTARVVRAETMRLRVSGFVLAAQAMGLGRAGILVRHILPNLVAPVVVLMSFTLAGAIGAEATLSFLGVGLPPGTISWGSDIAAAQSGLRRAPLVLLYPCVALAVAVLAFLLLGEALRGILDPRAGARR